MIALNRIYHPSLRVTDLDEVEEFFRKVFGRHTMTRSSLILAGWIQQPPTYPADYCVFTPLADTFIVAADPEKYVWEGRQRFPSISESHLEEYGWAVDQGLQEIWDRCQDAGIRLTDQWNTVVEGTRIPESSFKTTLLFHTLEDDAGLRYEFYPTSSVTQYDHRSIPGWRLPGVKEFDPVSIVRSSHHTVLTADVSRARRLLVDILGGVVFMESYNEIWGTESTFIRIGSDVHELAVPVSEASHAGRDLAKRAPLDSYYSIGFQTADLDKVARTLERNHVAFLHRSDSAIVTEPRDSIGVPWGFYAQPPYATAW